jgi:tetrahedral aminopeptidase
LAGRNNWDNSTMNELLKQLVEIYGPSGFEDQVRDLIRPHVEPLVDEITVDPMGNLIAHKQGPGHRVMIAAHMDEIGLMVSRITDDGFLRFTNIGGVFPHTLSGARVQFANGTTGVIYGERRDEPMAIHPYGRHYIDVGATGRDDCPVAVGDAATFQQSLVIQGSRWTSKAMDDRIGCLVLIQALQRLADLDSPYDLYFVFSVQEEIGTRGAEAAANRLDPEVSIAVDITPAGDIVEAEFNMLALGQGPAIKVKDTGMIAHPGLVRLMQERAAAAGIPYQLEVLERGSTDARAMQIANGGSAAGCISIVTRYAHSQSETVDAADVAGSVSLLVELLTHEMALW